MATSVIGVATVKGRIKAGTVFVKDFGNGKETFKVISVKNGMAEFAKISPP